MLQDYTRKAGSRTVTQQIRVRTVLVSMVVGAASLGGGGALLLYGHSIHAIGDAFELLLLAMILFGVLRLAFALSAIVLEVRRFNLLLRFLERGEYSGTDARLIMDRHGQGRGLGVAAVRSAFIHRSLDGGKDRPDMEPLLESLESQLSGPGYSVSSLASLTVLVGTLGTIAGMLLAMTAMSGASDVKGLVDTFFAPSGVLSGFSTALITSLIGGIGGGVVLRWLSDMYLRLCHRHALYVREILMIYIIPALYNAAGQE